MGQALEVGFDHLDTSDDYRNEAGVGLAIKESGIPRSSLYITTKFSAVDGKTPAQLCEESLQKLGTDYIDLYLIHHPRSAGDDIPGTWNQMEELKKAGKVKSIGVSNFFVDQLEQIRKSCTIPPSVNQIQYHPYKYASNKDLVAYMAKHHIVGEAYSPLIPITHQPGGPVDKPVQDIAAKHGVKAEQVLLAWVKAKGMVIVTTSSRKDRLESYLAVGDLELSHSEVKAIDEAGTKGEKAAARRETLSRLLPVILLMASLGYLAWRMC